MQTGIIQRGDFLLDSLNIVSEGTQFQKECSRLLIVCNSRLIRLLAAGAAEESEQRGKRLLLSLGKCRNVLPQHALACAVKRRDGGDLLLLRPHRHQFRQELHGLLLRGDLLPAGLPAGLLLHGDDLLHAGEEGLGLIVGGAVRLELLSALVELLLGVAELLSRVGELRLGLLLLVKVDVVVVLVLVKAHEVVGVARLPFALRVGELLDTVLVFLFAVGELLDAVLVLGEAVLVLDAGVGDLLPAVLELPARVLKLLFAVRELLLAVEKLLIGVVKLLLAVDELLIRVGELLVGLLLLLVVRLLGVVERLDRLLINLIVPNLLALSGERFETICDRLNLRVVRVAEGGQLHRAVDGEVEIGVIFL